MNQIITPPPPLYAQNGRINYIDALRGFTMFLVVLQHVESIGFGIHPYGSVLGYILVSFRMPMFFFISGYIAYKASVKWNTQTYHTFLRKKAKVQLIPTLFFFALITISASQNPVTSFVANGWGGYWFTVVLFEMFLIYYSLSYLCEKYLIPCLTVLSAICIISLVILRTDASWWNMLCMENLCKYFQFFSLGVIAKKYNTQFLSLVKNETARTAALLVFIISVVIITTTNLVYESFIARSLVRDMIVRYSSLFVVFAFFVGKEDFFNRENTLNKCMIFVGRRTLDIYMIHYFLLSSFPLLVPFVKQNIISEITVSMLLTIIIMSVSLLISELIRSSNFLAHYLFGVKRNE